MLFCSIVGRRSYKIVAGFSGLTGKMWDDEYEFINVGIMSENRFFNGPLIAIVAAIQRSYFEIYDRFNHNTAISLISLSRFGHNMYVRSIQK